MSEQPPEPEPESAPPAGPVPPAPIPHETRIEHLADWFRHHGPAEQAALGTAAAIASDARGLVHGHASAAFSLAADVLAGAEAHPEILALVPKMLEVVSGAVTIAGAAL